MDKIYKVYASVFSGKFSLNVYEARIKKKTKEHYFLDVGRSQDKMLPFDYINSVYKDNHSLMVWCEEKDIEHYKEIFPIQLKDNLKDLLDTQIKYHKKDIDSIDLYLNNKMEIKIYKIGRAHV